MVACKDYQPITSRWDVGRDPLILGRTERVRSARGPRASDVDLFRYCQGVIDLNAEIPDRAFDLGMPEQS